MRVDIVNVLKDLSYNLINNKLYDKVGIVKYGILEDDINRVQILENEIRTILLEIITLFNTISSEKIDTSHYIESDEIDKVNVVNYELVESIFTEPQLVIMLTGAKLSNIDFNYKDMETDFILSDEFENILRITSNGCIPIKNKKYDTYFPVEEEKSKGRKKDETVKKAFGLNNQVEITLLNEYDNSTYKPKLYNNGSVIVPAIKVINFKDPVRHILEQIIEYLKSLNKFKYSNIEILEIRSISTNFKTSCINKLLKFRTNKLYAILLDLRKGISSKNYHIYSKHIDVLYKYRIDSIWYNYDLNYSLKIILHDPLNTTKRQKTTIQIFSSGKVYVLSAKDFDTMNDIIRFLDVIALIHTNEITFIDTL